MENTLSVSLMIAFLLIGAVGGAILVPGNDTIEYVDVPVPGETKTVYQNVSVTEYVEIPAVNQLDLAVAEFLTAVEDEDIELMVEGENNDTIDLLEYYDFDEFELSKVYDEYTITYDDDKTTVDFEVKIKFKEKDETSYRYLFDVTVIFELEEDTEVESILA